jgi:hypothetical protein
VWLPLVFLSRDEASKEEKKRERKSAFVLSCCGRVVGMSFTVTTTTALNTRGLRMQNSSTLVGKRIGQKRGTFVNENRNAKARNGSRGIPIKAAKQGGGSGTRPYTLRSGDTLESIASKRKLNVETLRNMNKKNRLGHTEDWADYFNTERRVKRERFRNHQRDRENQRTENVHSEERRNDRGRDHGEKN